MDPSQSFSNAPEAWNSSEDPALPATPPPAYEYNPPGYPPFLPNQPVPQGLYSQGPYSGQSDVAVQPAVFVTTAPLTSPVPDYLGYSIFIMLCCFPLGIVGLIYSCSTRKANYSGQRQLAERYSKTALIVNYIISGIALVIIVIVIIVIAI